MKDLKFWVESLNRIELSLDEIKRIPSNIEKAVELSLQLMKIIPVPYLK